MASFKNITTKAKLEENTGFGSNSSFNGGRFIKKDGSSNTHVRGVSVLERYSMYHTMLDLPRWKFITTIFSFFIVINLAFASLYYLIGIEELGGIIPGSPLQNFGEAFFFSAQTFTTVGYGRINPASFLTSSIAAIEALTGLLSFAVVTGLFYGRFSRPRAFLRFSHNMVVAPHKGFSGLMFRMVPYKNNQLTEAEVKITLAMKVEEDGKFMNKFYSLDLEISKVNTLTLSWTVVHVINEKSPIYNFTLEDLIIAKAELLVFVKGFDEAFSNTVVAKTSYSADEIIFGAKFKIMYEAAHDGNSTILHIDRLNDMEKIELPVSITREPASTASAL